MFEDGEQTRADLSIRRHADAAAMSAEWVRHWSDDPDLSFAVFEDKASRRLALAA